jgi:serine/threonine protein phosphatase 1
MNLFVVGDVHGCFHTFSALLRQWNPEQERLIQVGDLVDRGRYSLECVELARELEAQHPGKTVFLLGNHEYEMLLHFSDDGPNTHWFNWGGRRTLQAYHDRPDLLPAHLAWLRQRPLYWENEFLLISHAGLADTPAPFEPANMDGVLWRRGPLRALGKRQVVGHTPTASGRYEPDPVADVLYVDTGAYAGTGLTALRLSPIGHLLAHLTAPTAAADVAELSI